LFKFLKACITDLITQLSSSLQNSDGGGDGNAVIVVLTPPPPIFYHFRNPKFNLQPLTFTFETFGKKFAKIKIFSRVNAKKIKKYMYINKALKLPAIKQRHFFYQNLSITVKVGVFLAAAEALLIRYE
jgi:hypothetical protein